MTYYNLYDFKLAVASQCKFYWTLKSKHTPKPNPQSVYTHDQKNCSDTNAKRPRESTDVTSNLKLYSRVLGLQKIVPITQNSLSKIWH